MKLVDLLLNIYLYMYYDYNIICLKQLGNLDLSDKQKYS